MEDTKNSHPLEEILHQVSEVTTALQQCTIQRQHEESSDTSFDSENERSSSLEEEIPSEENTVIVAQSSSDLYVLNTPLWSGTLCLISREYGISTPIATLAAFPQLMYSNTDCSYFNFDTWPLNLKVSGVCPAKQVILQYQNIVRVIIFKVLHIPSNNSLYTTQGQKCTTEKEEKSTQETSEHEQTTQGITNMETETQVRTNMETISTSETFLFKMLSQLHTKGLATVIELPKNTLLIVSHKERPLGILLPKLELTTKMQNPITAPPPILGATPCCICTESATYACLPCGHLCLCMLCLEKYRLGEKKTECPICRRQILSTARIFGN